MDLVNTNTPDVQAPTCEDISTARAVHFELSNHQADKVLLAPTDPERSTGW